MPQKRRAFLWSLAATATGLAGCLGNTPTRNASTAGRPTSTTEQPTTTAEPEPKYVHSGETIPAQSYSADDLDTLPLVAGPTHEVENPVLTADDVTDYGDADYVADPFMFVEEGEWHLFFEIVNHDETPDAPIGHATSSDGLHWEYDQVVLEKDHHTSFPGVFKWEGDYYMCPPTGKRVELWKADEFPTEWSKVGNLVDVDYYSHDPVVTYFDDRWWLFTDRHNQEVVVYYSDELETLGWTPHEGNPVVTDRRKAARQGGRPVVVDDEIFLFFQDLEDQYGDKIRGYRVTDLTPGSYDDEELACSPILSEFGVGWNATSMHTFDPWRLGDGEGWRCSVDGTMTKADYSIGIYDVEPLDPGPSPDDLVDQFGVDLWTDFETDVDGVVVDRAGRKNGQIRDTKSVDHEKLGAGRSFGTDRDRVLVPHEFRERLTTRDFTLLLSVAPGSGEAGRVLDYGKRDKTRGLRVTTDGGGWTVTPDDGGTRGSMTGGDATSATTLALVRDGDYYAYADGEKLGSVTDVGTFHFHNSYFALGGATTGGENFDGSVHGLWLVDHAMDESELADFTDAERSWRAENR